jgi:hypothetical protein
MADFMPVAVDKVIRAFVICVDCHRLVEARDRLGFRARARLAGATDFIADNTAVEPDTTSRFGSCQRPTTVRSISRMTGSRAAAALEYAGLAVIAACAAYAYYAGVMAVLIGLILLAGGLAVSMRRRRLRKPS